MDTLDIQAVESKLSDVTVTAVPLTTPNKYQTNTNNQTYTSTSNNGTNNVTSTGLPSPQPGLSKYAQLLMVIEEMSREVRPTYAGSRSSAERLRRNIISAKSLVKECLIEAEKSSRQ